MTLFRLALRNLHFHRRMHAWVLAGVALASMILTGALVVGDSVDYSLRSYALARLGGIRVAVDSRPRLFAERLAGELGKRAEGHAANETERKIRDTYGDTAAALSLRAMAIREGANGEASQVNGVNAVGVSDAFWMLQYVSTPRGETATTLPELMLKAIEDAKLAVDLPAGALLGPNEVALNERLASALSVNVGDEIALRIQKPGLLSRDAPLSSREEDSSRRVRCTVKWLLPDNGIGRFSLSASQTPPYNAFVKLPWLQDEMEAEGQVNLALMFEGETEQAVKDALAESWQLEDAGLRLRRHPNGIVQLESGHIFLDDAVAKTALALPSATGSLTYLVNGIAKNERATPYSFVVAGPVPPAMKDDEVLINRWLADALGAGRGDDVVVTYFELQPSNDFVEKTRTFRVYDAVEMDALRVERELAPLFPGLSDVERCEDWNVGMPMDEELLKDKANEAYWNAYGQTPKALFTLAAGRKMWSTRFGDVMAVRYPDALEPSVREALQRGVAPEEVGLRVTPVREQALAAVSQAMDLGGLFLGMSFFLIVSALILTTLLFVFSVQQRAEEMGTLLAVGFRPSQVRRVFLMEAIAVALIGSGLGAWAATVYTQALLAGLTHYWQGAVANTAIQYHTTPATLAQGAGINAVCCIAALMAAMWRQTRRSARELLVMDFTQNAPASAPRRAGIAWPLGAIGLAVGLVLYALAAKPHDVLGPFFGAGALLLIGGLGLCRFVLNRVDAEPSALLSPTLFRLAIQNASRRRGRSLSIVALLSTGCFLVLAVSAMQVDIGADAHERWSGTGGFELFAESTVPLVENLTAGIHDEDLDVIPIRVHDGDDASCLNLNRAQTPRLLGVNAPAFSQRRAFSPEHTNSEDMWQQLDRKLPGGAVPALVGDSDTAMWGLRKKADIKDGDVLTYRDETGRDVKVKLVGTLPMRLSVFQGALLISDAAFTRMYPSEEGFRMFLLDTPPGAERDWAARLNKRFAKAGFEPVAAVERLRQFYVVESTYLSMFLALGGLGLVLGTTAMGVVVLRNLLERRREVAILRAVGFQERAVFRLFFAEYGLLLAIGIALGAITASLAMLPTVLASSSTVKFGLQGAILAAIVASGVGCIIAGLRVGLGRGDTSALRDE